jgi:hypothetical protein
MIDYEKILAIQPYSLNKLEKEELYRESLYELTIHHREHCNEYLRITNLVGMDVGLPVRLFKEYDLYSIPKDQIIKTMTSSGTTGQAVSKIYLDRETSGRQSKVLSKIVSDFTGKTRMPLLIIDSSAVLKNRAMFSARGAGILGFSMLGRDLTYALDENMELDMPALETFLGKYSGERVVLFGFTFIIWQYFCEVLKRSGIRINLDGVLIHGGGWKKLADQNISNEVFKRVVAESTGIKNVYNYYGMVEQTGSIFMECEYGHLHCSIFSDVNIINPNDFSKNGINERGLIQCDSLLPTSYPGHRLLTEDEGEILGEDDCPCGRLGKYFKVYGRVKGAEIRGCSDTYERR